MREGKHRRVFSEKGLFKAPPEGVGRRGVVKFGLAVNENDRRGLIFVGFPEEAVHGQDQSHDGPVFPEGLKAVIRATGKHIAG